LHIVRSSDDVWEPVVAGVWAKRLYVDKQRDTVTMLVRMDPGASYVPHRHAGPEQCFVLEGDLQDGNVCVRAGDFQCAAEGTVHGAQRTESGCVLLIVSSLRDELLD
jgi:anti-sigma factor ChrR (cupin superfamily)